MIQGGIIAETRLNQVEQAKELYAMAREKSSLQRWELLMLRLRIRSGDWHEVVEIITEQGGGYRPSRDVLATANVIAFAKC